MLVLISLLLCCWWCLVCLLVLLHSVPLFVFAMFICTTVRFLPPSNNASPPQSGALRNSGRGPGSSRRALTLTQVGATSAAVAAELFPLEAPRPRPHDPTLAIGADADSTDVFLAAERAATVIGVTPAVPVGVTGAGSGSVVESEAVRVADAVTLAAPVPS
jgi:hypothetical protein